MKKILLVEGNLREVNQEFTDNGIKTHTESLKESINYFTNNLEIDSVNPSSDSNIFEKVKDLDKYDGLIWGGSSLNIYSDTIEIRKQIDFMRECQKRVKNILAICWGLQVAVTAAGGEVKQGTNGAHRGIAHEIIINSEGLKHLLYKDKKQTFNTPAFNYDEVVTLPAGSTLLSSNKVNKVMGLNFKSELSDIWGIQYHPEITYEKMITLINFRKERLLQNKSFNSEEDMNSHINIIESEIKISNKDLRMRELRNWLNFI
ncbi:gamma-glutamyl-gamma-aminobutyrate hydrolase family protein [Candidatus Pelagibacter sp.]|nr:gamma-glutamyl-gamma-aminobutyrate hydrolase family protein [Candidatus Pelagibacter sp.]|tara:strand:- start:20 stop:799 length:780 start_codon:yes stop_codon:yes gene_type:complete